MEIKEDLLKKFKSVISDYPKENIQQILTAYEFAEKNHEGQKRASGEEFITHPLSVAINLALMHVNFDMIIAGLLHDVVEDTNIPLKEIKDKFGEYIASLIDGVTKISKLKPNKPLSEDETKAETIRKMLVAMINDKNIIVIKFADKLHNMRTLNFLPEEKRKKIAHETLEIYAPLAGKMGMHYIKDQLEDLALRWIAPDVYSEINNYFNRIEKDRERTKLIIERKISEKLKNSNTQFTIHSRTKHYYSIYKKMKKYNKGIDSIFDLYGIRVITDTIEDCYHLFGTIHSLWQPIPSRFRDFIAHPKKNGYRSLHTTIILEHRKAVEIQIRTKEMQEFNEYGIAAHWYYKNGQSPSSDQLKWLAKLKEVHSEALSPDEYYKIIRDDILKDEIYLFTPKGDIIELPKGATPIDFAYRIHTEIGHRCRGAKANGTIIPISSPLKNGMIVEIITSKIPNPKASWLSFVKTSNARKKIKSFFANKRTEELEPQKSEEKRPEEKKEKQKAKTSPIINKKFQSAKITVEVSGEKNLLFNFANCCKPVPGDDIIGYISRGRGIIIHRKDCHNAKYIKDIKNRTVEVSWAIETKNKVYSFVVRVQDNTDPFSMIGNVVQKYNGSILKYELDKGSIKDNKLDGYFSAEFTSSKYLNIIMKEIRKIPSVYYISLRD